jgi:hypothetical protein
MRLAVVEQSRCRVFELARTFASVRSVGGGREALPGPFCAAFLILQSYAPKLRAQPSKRLWNVDISWPSPEEFATQTGLLHGGTAASTAADGSSPRTATPTPTDVATADAESERRSRARWSRAALSKALGMAPTGVLAAALADAYATLVLVVREDYDESAAGDRPPSLSASLGLPTASLADAVRAVATVLAGDGGPVKTVVPLAMGGHGYVTSSSPRKRSAASSPAVPASPTPPGPGLRESMSHPVPGLPMYPPSSSPGAALSPSGSAAPVTPKTSKHSKLFLRKPLTSPGSAVEGRDSPSSTIGVVHVHKGTVIHAESPDETDLTATAPASTAPLRDLLVEGCSDAFIYVMRPFRHAAVRACSNTTVVIGAASGVLTVDLCEGCHVIAAASQVRVGNSVRSTMSVYCASPPVVFGDSRDVRFSPHCAPFRGMSNCLAAARLIPSGSRSAPSSGKWSQFVCLGFSKPPASTTTSGGVADYSDDAVYPAKVLSPELFSFLVVPSPGGVAGAEDQAIPLPSPYADAVKSQRDRVVRMRSTIKAANIPKPSQEKLRGCVEAAFKQWLIASGSVRQVADLVRMHSRPHHGVAMHSPGGTRHVLMGVMSPSLYSSSSSQSLLAAEASADAHSDTV